MYAWFIRTGFEKLDCTHLQTQPGRIQPIDSSQLANGADNPQGRAQNRRVEFVLPKR
ncbi:hypothetical protein L551_1059 [Bordetella pertussis STO1-SEAT-0004]|uniref:hypothetical protein n=1 Tax=Bordetella pertussis TaxID=520 RepID=UPI0003D3EB37|nr:hypothetical protein [Bordetella pertussis]ETI01634.1 hypothetical protein L551_1059 [Bordetella pertussis STO1-SEAT-0004]